MQDIEIYYESIRQVYIQQPKTFKIRRTPKESIILWLSNLSTILLVGSLVPIIPFSLIFFGSRLSISTSYINFSRLSPFNIFSIWIGCVIIAVCLTAILYWVNTTLEPPEEQDSRPSQTLSPEQLTLISVYEAYKELKIYFISHVDQHVHNSLSALKRSMPSVKEKIRLEEIEKNRPLTPIELDAIYFADRMDSIRSERTSLSKQIAIGENFLKAFETHDWLQLNEATKSTLQAFVSFPDKILYRLSNREDLPSVLNVLEDLSKLTYAFLPEHKTYMDSAAITNLHLEGLECFNRFVNQVNNMTQYAIQSPEQRVIDKMAVQSFLDKMRHSGYIDIASRFTGWFIILFILTLIGVNFIQKWYMLTPDTVVTLVIGTSVAGATALTGILPKGVKAD